MRTQFINWLESHMSVCPFMEMTGASCPGCGVQRAFILLLKGELWDSIVMYPALIPMLTLFSFLIVHLIFKFKKGGIFLMYNFILAVGLIIFNYLFKIFS